MLPGGPPDRYNLHFQETTVTQVHPDFHAAYSGQNSLPSDTEFATTLTSTLYGGLRTWEGGEVFLNPEIAGGSGLGTTLGVAGFPNGEAFRIGNPAPTIYLARLFVRQTWPLGGPEVEVEDGPNQLAKQVRARRITLVAGRFAATDIFDVNEYAGNPREQFLNWTLMASGAWDYPADTRGYTYGVALEYDHESFAVRGGAMMVPTEANGPDMDLHLWKAHAFVVEAATYVSPLPRRGAARLLLYINSAHMGNYDQAVAETHPPNIVDTDRYGRVRYGFAISADQEITESLGAFSRLSWSYGANETWSFTEVDQSVALGISVAGTPWKRKDDNTGAALVVNGIAEPHRAYLAAGGYGFLIGDGALDYSFEGIAEAYYRFALTDKVAFTGDYQFILHPAYNTARGPVNVFGVRAHISF
jgi:high affinity Mn2+ porin